MDIQAISEAATVAIACAIVFLLVAKTWFRLSRALTGNPSFSDSIMSEAAQRFRDELRTLSRDQSVYLGTGLVFVVMYGAVSMFQGPELFVGYPTWQIYILLAALAAAALFALYRVARTVLVLRHVRFVRDANVAIGHQLQRIASSQGRVYHDVPTAAGYIDHVLIGQNGIYAISVVARRHYRQGSVFLDGDELSFSKSDKTLPVVDIAARATRLAKELKKLTGHGLRVRSVIAVPGWEIAEQTNPEHLLVNERNLPMMSGWKDPADYLMDEDVDALQKNLTERCKLR